MRNLLGFTQPTPEEGDKLICLRSNKKRNFVNGSMWSVLAVNGEEEDRICAAKRRRPCRRPGTRKPP
jgi:hypothetical protein